MVAPERQRQGVGEGLFRTWDRSVGASLGLGLSDSSQRLFKKLRVAGAAAGAVPGKAAQPPRAQAAAVARRAERLRLGSDPALHPSRRSIAAPASGGPVAGAISDQSSRSCGIALRRVRACGAPRRGIPELEVCRGAACPLFIGALLRTARCRLRGLSSFSGTARPRRRGSWTFWPTPTTWRVSDAAPMGRPRGDGGRLGQDQDVCCTLASASAAPKSGYFVVKSTMDSPPR